MQGVPDGLWYYQQLELGYNYRITDIQAALGISQLNRLDNLVEIRNNLAEGYAELLKGFPIILPQIDSSCYSSFHLYIIRIPKDLNEYNRKEVFEKLRVNGVGVNVHYIPVYRHPYYKKFNIKYDNFPEAECYYSEAISIPIFPALTKEQQIIICNTLLSPIGYQSLF